MLRIVEIEETFTELKVIQYAWLGRDQRLRGEGLRGTERSGNNPEHRKDGEYDEE
jgi:hypothetical protein